MHTPPRPSLLRRWLRLPAPRPPRPDPADMGTACAMDYVLDQPPLPPPPCATARPWRGPRAGAIP